MRLGIPYRYGFMLVTAFRLEPLLEDEAQTIYRAQLVRGIQYDHGSLKRIFLLIQQFLTPLLISALHRADNLVFSMEGRGFGRNPKRTYRNQISPTILDLYVSVVISLFFGVLILINYGVLL
jgi:energy-coupling factor transport system permease protein